MLEPERAVAGATWIRKHVGQTWTALTEIVEVIDRPISNHGHRVTTILKGLESACVVSHLLTTKQSTKMAYKYDDYWSFSPQLINTKGVSLVVENRDVPERFIHEPFPEQMKGHKDCGNHPRITWACIYFELP